MALHPLQAFGKGALGKQLRHRKDSVTRFQRGAAGAASQEKEDRAGEDAGVLKWKGKKVKGCR